MYDIITIGAATVDIFVKTPSFIVKDNYLSIAYASKNEMSQSLIASGGGATNAAASLSRLGQKSGCLALVGQDPLAQFVLRDLIHDKIDSDLLIRSPDVPTDFSVILVAPDGGRSIITNRGPTRLETANIHWDKLANTEWFYISSLEGNLELLEQLIGFASEHQIKVALNPGNRELAQTFHLIPLISHIEFLLLNTTESKVLTGIEVNKPNFWEKLASFGSVVTAVTDGRHGAYVQTAQEKLFSPIINTTPIDETGAGDAFGSAFVAALMNRLTPQEALFWGIKNSASAVSQIGAKPGLLTFTEIKS